MVWCRALKFITLLEYEYAQVTVDLFCENVTLVHCSVVVCNYVSPFYFGLKECVVISKFGSTVSCGLTRETRLAKYKPIFWRTHLLDSVDCMNVPTSMVTGPFTRWSLSGENEVLHGRKWSAPWENSCLSITRTAGSHDKVYNSLKSWPQNFLINYVGVSVYRHLNTWSWDKNHSTQHEMTIPVIYRFLWIYKS